LELALHLFSIVLTTVSTVLLGILYRVRRAAELEGIDISCIWHNSADRRHSPREKISAHYAYALENVFHHTRTSHEYAILLEDDLEFAPDFIQFITAFLPHLSRDRNDGVRTVCISGWNDNGASPARCHPSRVSRTTYFPGLGWALSRGFWKSALQKLWPGIGTGSIVGTGWDYWMRTQFDAHGWNCITPEVPRVFHFGSDGTNVGAVEKAIRFDDSRLASVDAGNINWTNFAGRFLSEDANCLSRVVSNASQVHGLDDPSICDLEWDCEPSSPSSSDCDPEKIHFVMLYNREDYLQHIAGLPALRLWPLPRGHFKYTLTLHMTRGRVLHVIDKRRSEMLAQDLRPRLPDIAIISPASDGESCTLHCVTLGRATGNAYECSVSGLEYVNTCPALRSRFPCTQCMYETGSDLPAYVVPAATGILQTAGTCLVTETGYGSDGRLDCDGAFKWTRRLCVCDVKSPSSHQLGRFDYARQLEIRDEL
jgi:hypothetical protein